jgi:hypothetical protein
VHVVEFFIGPDADEAKREQVKNICLLSETLEQIAQVVMMDASDTLHLHEYEGILFFNDPDLLLSYSLETALTVSEITLRYAERYRTRFFGKIKILVCLPNHKNEELLEAFSHINSLEYVKPSERSELFFYFQRHLPNLSGQKHLM